MIHMYKVWGNVPTQNNLLLKYSKFKMIGIIIYNYIATTFFFLLEFQFLFSDFFGSGSEREGLWVWDLGFRVLRVLAGIDWVNFGFWRFFKVVSVGLG